MSADFWCVDGSGETVSYGSRISYKCMDFLMFESHSAKFQFPCANTAW